MQTVLEALAERIPLSPLTCGKEFVVKSDASIFAFGGVIEQDGNPIMFYSASMLDNHRKWSAGDKEFYAAYRIITDNRQLLEGSPIRLLTDHKPLVDWKPEKHPDKVVNWMGQMLEMGVVFEHITGNTNFIADALSRSQQTFEEDQYPGNPSTLIESCANFRIMILITVVVERSFNACETAYW